MNTFTTTFSQKTKSTKSSKEYENSSHIVKKQKAAATAFKKKNLRDVVDLLDEEDFEIAEKYAPYVK